MEKFEPEPFIKNQTEKISEVIGKEKALIALSGGVDSATCAVLTHRAIGDNLICVILDDAFMREREPERVKDLLSKPPCSLPVKVERVQDRFLEALKGLEDAEEKRKAFRETFYRTLGDIAKREKSGFLVQGTILADIIETKGGIKTQHNVLEQMGISTKDLYGFRVVEPLVSLLKWQVRQVARYLELPSEFAERQPFPGPGLSVRVVGEINLAKLQTLRNATTITEMNLAKHKPSQYFAVIVDNEETHDKKMATDLEMKAVEILKISPKQVSSRTFRDRATGTRQGARTYGQVVALSIIQNRSLYVPDLSTSIKLQEAIIDEHPSVTRVWIRISDEEKMNNAYTISIRAVKTEDFLTAQVADIPSSTLRQCSSKILRECPLVSCVYYDITPKPPATIEME